MCYREISGFVQRIADPNALPPSAHSYFQRPHTIQAQNNVINVWGFIYKDWCYKKAMLLKLTLGKKGES